MFSKPPFHKHCPVCNAKIPALATICLYCEEPLLSPDDIEDSMYAEAVMLTTIDPDGEDLLEILDAAEFGSMWGEGVTPDSPKMW